MTFVENRLAGITGYACSMPPSSVSSNYQSIINESPFPNSPMPHVLIIHEVADYPTWKAIFDNAAQLRKDAGEQSYQVLKYEEDANKIVHFSKWSSLANAKAFFESQEVQKIREAAGVKAPEFIYLDELAQGIL